MSDTFNFGIVDGYTPYEGDGASIDLGFEGSVSVKITKLKQGKSKTSGNDTVKVTMRVNDDDLTAKGILYSDIPVSGTRSDGKQNAEKFFDFLLSCGWPLDQLNAMAKGKKAMSFDEIFTKILNENNIGYVTVSPNTYQGRTSSRVDNFITKAKHEENVAAGTHRQFTSRAAAPAANGAAAAGGADPLRGLVA